MKRSISTSGRYLLDTNIVIGIFASNGEIITRLRDANEIFIPSIVLGELYFGARNFRHTDEHVVRIEAFRQANVILSCGATTAQYYGEIKSKLEQIGRPIPENDIWIAALAREYNLVIASRDRHFDAIDVIMTEAW